MRGERDLIGVVETAYRIHDDAARWVEETADAAGPVLGDDEGLGWVACLFDREAASPREILAPVAIRGMDLRIMAAMVGEFEGGTDADRARSLKNGGPTLRLTGLAGMPLHEVPAYAALASELGFVDVMVVRAANPDGTGAFFGAPVRRAQPRGPFERRWSRIAAHLAAGVRLQRSAARLVADRASSADAVLTPGGRILSASGDAQGALTALREAATRIDRARTRAGRRDADNALERWQALVDGRWSLVDHFESDGKRFVIAVENAPSAPDPRGLTPKERSILHFTGMGHSNKLIAYELGMPDGSVATSILTIARKLGVGSRAELVARYHTLRRARFERVEVEGAKVLVGRAAPPAIPIELTAAEREVAELAAKGRANAAIASARRCSPRTVANLLQSVYRKLGVRSRAELAGRLAGADLR